jgi:DNA adenine methylase/adenine-specific DNA-methyltransferase
MGSKYRVVPHLAKIFADLNFDRVLDGFSGSGVVGYTLKAMGKEVVTNDFLSFPATVARAVIENAGEVLDQQDIAQILAPSSDGRDFIQRTFAGLYFPVDDLAFLDAAWSHIEGMSLYKRALAISALCHAAARKQPRGVFTVVDFRYDDGRRFLRTPLRDLFVESTMAYNNVVFSNGRTNQSWCRDILDVDPDNFDLVYFDPPYAPPRDDNDYIKRYHFLEGLSVYWRGQKIMEHTITKKIEKRFTPFAYKHTIRQALEDIFSHFKHSILVLSYSSNSIPSQDEILNIMNRHKRHVEVHTIPHTYSFGTHATALRRDVNEYVFVAR